MNRSRSAIALVALLADPAAHAQNIGTEVGVATVWFALLVVLFALLVSVGLYMARDHDNDADDGEAARPAASTSDKRLCPTPRRSAASGHKQRQ